QAATQDNARRLRAEGGGRDLLLFLHLAAVAIAEVVGMRHLDDDLFVRPDIVEPPATAGIGQSALAKEVSAVAELDFRALDRPSVLVFDDAADQRPLDQAELKIVRNHERMNSRVGLKVLELAAIAGFVRKQSQELQRLRQLHRGKALSISRVALGSPGLLV